MTEALTAARLAAPHGFFTRAGGVSEGPFASLNCSLSGQDRMEAVMENRARAARALGADPAMLVGLTQIHGAGVVAVDVPWRPGEGPARRRGGDGAGRHRARDRDGGLRPGCLLLVADAEAGVIGAAHAGWRGAVAGVLEATVAAMVRLGAAPSRIAAAVGPCIGQALL